VLRGGNALRRDRLDNADGPFQGDLVVDADLLVELAIERVDEALAGVDAAARKQPVGAAPGFLVAAEEDPPAPPEHRRDPDPRLDPHQAADDPKPRTPRSLWGSSLTSTGSTAGTGMTT